jgi:hypothetical protein
MSKRKYLEFLKSSKPKFDEITITIRDLDQALIKFLTAAQGTANVGHSYPVTIDGDDAEHKQEFFFDGDGSFYIKDIKLNGKKWKEEK